MNKEYIQNRIEQVAYDGATDGYNQAVIEREAEKLVTELVKLFAIPAVVKSLPTDECVEQWWAEGQDPKEGFWQGTPSRTNGDVVEEIKTALKYFIETWQR